MRFALIATSIAAAVAVPFAMAASEPQMSSDQFLQAVRCTAYEGVTGADISESRYALNAEAQRQSPMTAAEAQAEVEWIARKAVNTQTAAEAAMIRQERAAACQGALLADGTERSNAV